MTLLVIGWFAGFACGVATLLALGLIQATKDESDD
jgi:hypothetical protein